MKTGSKVRVLILSAAVTALAGCGSSKKVSDAEGSPDGYANTPAPAQVAQGSVSPDGNGGASSQAQCTTSGGSNPASTVPNRRMSAAPRDSSSGSSASPAHVTQRTATTVASTAPIVTTSPGQTAPTRQTATDVSATSSDGPPGPGAVREFAQAINVSRVSFAEEGADFDPSVSRDGTHIVFASTQHSKTSDIYIKRTDSRVVTQLTNDPGEDAMPAISPDGTKIAFASDRSGNWDIYVMPIIGGKAVQITCDATDEIHPSWSADGRQLVFCRLGAGSGRWEMWTVDVQNPSVSNFIGYGMFPQWCPVAGTGQGGADRILFQLGRERGRRAFGLWTIDVGPNGATNATEISSSPTTALIIPAWSPDGRWIVYSEVPVVGDDGAVITERQARHPAWSRLWMVSVEGDGRVRLTSGPGVALSPTWGGNNRLFFVCDRTGAENIWSLDINSAVQSARATGAGEPSLAKAPATPAQNNTPTNPIANVPEGDPQSNAGPR